MGLTRPPAAPNSFDGRKKASMIPAMSFPRMTIRRWGFLALLVCALIWGFAFSAQSLAMEHLGPCGFNGLRTLVGVVFLVPCIVLIDLVNGRTPSVWGMATTGEARRRLLLGGAFCGIALGLASLAQQIGIVTSSAGKAGFISSLYIIMVPIIGAFIGHRAAPQVWLAAFCALLGMALLCNLSLDSGFTVGDYWLLACSIGFAIQILLVALFVKGTDPVRLSCVQFMVAAAVSLAFVPLNHESIPQKAVLNCIGPLLFCGVLSCGVAYTLQIIGEKYVHPVVASLVMSLESVFSAVGGWLVLGQVLSVREVIGCTVIFAAIILAQLRQDKTEDQG